MCTATRTSSYSPVGPSVFFVYLALVCALCVHLCFLIDLCVPFLICFPGQLSHLPYSVTNLGLNEPPIAFATSTIMWVRS